MSRIIHARRKHSLICSRSSILKAIDTSSQEHQQQQQQQQQQQVLVKNSSAKRSLSNDDTAFKMYLLTMVERLTGIIRLA